MNVLFISNDPSLFVHGSPTRERMMRYAKEIGSLHIISRAPKGAQKEVEGPLTLHPVHGRIRALLSLPRKIRTLIQKEGIEVVSAQDPFEHGFVAYLGGRGTTAKLHVQIHTDFLSPSFAKESLIQRMRVRLARFLLPHADGIRVVSHRIARSLEETFGNRVAVASVIPIAHGPAGATSESVRATRFPFTFLTASRLVREKRVSDIVHALKSMKRTDTGLVVVGDGKERRALERLAKDLGIASRVAFLGWSTELASLMKSADVYVQVSAYEGYGRTLIEAGEAGVPIITTDVGVVGEVFTQEDVCIVPHEDVTALAQVMDTLSKDSERRVVLAKNAYTKAMAHLAQFQNLPDMIRNDLSRTLRGRA